MSDVSVKGAEAVGATPPAAALRGLPWGMTISPTLPTGAVAPSAPTAPAPPALHRGESDLPFVDMGDRSLQVLQVDLGLGLWIVRDRFAPGAAVQTHRHTGPVYAFTQTGSWYYREFPDALNTAGSFLFEPAGSQHTLVVPDTNDGLTDVWFSITGALLNLTPDGDVETVSDAASALAVYRRACAEQHGLADPPVIVLNERR